MTFGNHLYSVLYSLSLFNLFSPSPLPSHFLLPSLLPLSLSSSPFSVPFFLSISPSSFLFLPPFSFLPPLSLLLSSPAPLSKEGLWQNWMSTSGCAQLESEVHLHNGSLHTTHSHYSHYHYGDGVEGDSGYGDSLKSGPPSCECGHDHGATSSTTTYASSYGSQGGYVYNQ